MRFTAKDYLTTQTGLGSVSLVSLIFAAAFLCVFPVSHSYAYEKNGFEKPVSNRPQEGTKVDVEASRIVYDVKTKTATALGRVHLVYGPYILDASKVVYNEETEVFQVTGEIKLVEPNGNILLAESAEIRDRFRSGFAHHVKALLSNNTSITAKYVSRKDGGVIIYEQASYTACQNCVTHSGKPVWELTADTATHNVDTHTLYYKNPRLRFGGVPVGWLPYASLPDPSVKRRTGFLFPGVKVGKAYGAGLVTPYFVELGRSADLTFRPVWTIKQGPIADVEYRQQLDSGKFNLRGIGVHQFSRKHVDDKRRWRGALTSDGAFQITPHLKWGWDGTLVSDRQFLDEYGYDGRDLIINQAYLTGLKGRNYFSGRVMKFRTLAHADQQKFYPSALPYIENDYTFNRPVLGGEVSSKWTAYFIRRDHSNSPFTSVEHGREQIRTSSTTRWQRQFITPSGFIIDPFAQVRSDVVASRHLRDSRTRDYKSHKVKNRIMPSAGIDMRWPLMANSSLGQSVLTPVFQAVTSTNEKKRHWIGNEDAITVNFDASSLFLSDRFTGVDRAEGGTRINTGLLYTLLGQNGAYARMAVGESFHVAGRNSFDSSSGLHNTRSDIVGSILLQPWQNVSLSYQVAAKNDFSAIRAHEALLSYTYRSWNSSIGYTRLESAPTEGRRYKANQISTYNSLQMTESWRIFSGMQYDFVKNNFRNRSVGVAYDCDCMTASLTYTQSRDDDVTARTSHKVMFSMDLRTLGNFVFSAGPKL